MSLTNLVFASVVANLGLSLAQDVEDERLLAGVMRRASVGPVGDVGPVVEEGLLTGGNEKLLRVYDLPASCGAAPGRAPE